MNSKKVILDAIALALDSIRQEIQVDPYCDKNKTRSESIKILADAYNTIRRGK